MHIHILGICGTFMGGIAVLAKQLGHRVTGQDANVYPPMSTQLEEQGIELIQGFDSLPMEEPNQPDMVIIGNALSRGNSAVEYILNQNINYTSGAQWLADHVLHDQWVLAVAGTHGKTTTSSMLAWILEYAGLKPGFLIGGVPENFGVSSRSSEAGFFVVEADEYDTAFFDKRSKFVHYHPRTAIINNIEFDHADIFADLAAIETQFHHLIRTIPSQGLLIQPANDTCVSRVLDRGCWTASESFTNNLQNDAYWQAEILDNARGNKDGSQFNIICQGNNAGKVSWNLIGLHNVSNAIAAIAAARHVGIPVKYAIEALSEFKNVKRRMELRGEVNQIRVYDDFAHHPTAIDLTIDGLRKQVGTERIIAIVEPRSNTMRMQVHNQQLSAAFKQADKVCFYLPEGYEDKFDFLQQQLGDKLCTYTQIEQMASDILAMSQPNDHLLVMSNGGFSGIHEKLLNGLKQ
ncbi:MAG: UDP-N-acetylmuramate:L-alanyl-gamma-D-glutamyl-meso-diaminopimelate ligase [Pseudomonadota bacterium]